jgi:hypothetical protein
LIFELHRALGLVVVFILFLATKATLFKFNKYKHLKSNTRGVTLILATITKTKQELAYNNNIVKSLKVGSFKTSSCITDWTIALAFYYN